MSEKVGSRRFKLNQIEDRKIPASEHLDGEKIKYHKYLNTPQDWLRALPGVNRMRSPNDFKNFRVIQKSFQSQNTHAGLIFYAHFCWAKELGMVLRPDLLWYTIISEITEYILKFPDYFRYLFTDTEEKKDLILDIYPGFDQQGLEILTYAFTTEVRRKIANQQFFDLICNSQFESAPPLYRHAMATTMLCMGTPYFNYSTVCGIPFVDIQGDLSDWLHLYNQTVALRNFIPDIECPIDFQQDYGKYLNQCRNVIENIIFFAFNHSVPDLIKMEYNSPEEFFNDVFHYGKNKCGSGHDDRIVKGWLRRCYWQAKEDLHRFPTHLNYFPWDDIPSKKMYVHMVGMGYSEIQSDGLAVPDYGCVTYQVLDIKIYSLIAKRDEEHLIKMWKINLKNAGTNHSPYLNKEMLINSFKTEMNQNSKNMDWHRRKYLIKKFLEQIEENDE